MKGLSPRVRGIRSCGYRCRAGRGSIPACAGDPINSVTSIPRKRVYPRVCGGSAPSDRPPTVTEGLSPRVRGIRLYLPRVRLHHGSIPACAGDPPERADLEVARKVYPRVCGGSDASNPTPARSPGLSPRVRGIPAHDPRRCSRCGSIPACAGDPRESGANGRSSRVYPRVCGGSAAVGPQVFVGQGLSPRVRGIQDDDARAIAMKGSIPACAGDPDGIFSFSDIFRVYPRVCGGSISIPSCGPLCPGLSPRVRGILVLDDRIVPGPGSIPACAGDPRRLHISHSAFGVYPRVCGGSVAIRPS